MQSQLNPHFLFNTLNAVLVVSMKNEYREILPILRNLCKLMRRLLNWSDELVTVEEEMAFVDMYLQTEKFRFRDKFSYEIDYPQEAASVLLPKMTIQPLVENACKYGIQKSVDGGKIRVTVRIKEEWLWVSIQDNGAGMTQERIHEIKEAFNQPPTSSQCVGMRNVYRRLELYYDKEFTFNMESAPGEGTIIRIFLPTDAKKGKFSLIKDGDE